MKGGDLSNVPAPTVAIRFERVIRTEEGRLNRAAHAFLQGLFRDADVNIHIVTTGAARKAMGFAVKWGVPYAHVIAVDSTLEIPLICMASGISIYYDVDREVLANVESRAGHITEAKTFEALEVA